MEEGHSVERGWPDGDIRALESLAFGPIRFVHLATPRNHLTLTLYAIQVWPYHGPFAGWEAPRLCG